MREDDARPSAELRLVGPGREQALLELDAKRKAYRVVEQRDGVGGHEPDEVEPKGWIP